MAKEAVSEVLARAFLKLTRERYPTPDKILKMASRLGFRSVPQQIACITQFRNAVRLVSPRLYRNHEHRDDIFNAIVEALEDLEDQMEELLEEEEAEEEAEGEETVT